jgi:hypothetical protein
MSANSTVMFQGLDPNARLSSKVLRPPGGGSTDIFGIHDAPGETFTVPYLPKKKKKCTERQKGRY